MLNQFPSRVYSRLAIKHTEMIEKKADDIEDKVLDLELGSGYGIFAGKDIKWATIRFSPERARWVSTEKWHPNQIGVFLDNGSYELKVPFSNTRELCMDILKHGADVTVISPVELIEEVIKEAKSLIENHK